MLAAIDTLSLNSHFKKPISYVGPQIWAYLLPPLPTSADVIYVWSCSSLPFTCGLSDGVEEVLEKLEAMDAENRPVSIFLSQGEELFQLWLTGKL